MADQKAGNKTAPRGQRGAANVAGEGVPTTSNKYTAEPKTSFNPIEAQTALDKLSSLLPGTMAGELRRAYADVFRAFLAGGTEPEIIEQAAQIYAGQAKTLQDAIAPRPRQGDVITGLLPERSLSIAFGQPGGHKTNVIADWLMGVASGQRIMPSLPGQGNDQGREVRQGPVLIVDVDNGEDVLAERLAAFMRGYDADASTPVHWLTFPTPPIMASKGMPALTAYAKSIGAVMVVFDNLLRVAGVRDENSSEMDVAMNNLKRFAEETNAAVVCIHHQRKPSGKGETARAGATLRGHSSIEAAIDYAFLIEREEDTDTVMVRCTKSRRRGVAPFGAMFTYESTDDGNLHKARFYRVEVMTAAQKKLDERKGKILAALSGEELNTRSLFEVVGGNREAFDKAKGELLLEKKIKSRSKGQETIYFLP